MPNYKYDAIKREFKSYLAKSKDKSTKAVHDFCQEKGITNIASQRMPALITVYRWRDKITGK